ncbi:non-canonical purine NTP pyrophosphatase [Candidatus Saccharibacteria bacterium oral taxon 488]|nr:non-canonical purine NTP pyrophosphatase [Candidatus Saccharibacteria bacterium oral taxon 488]
MDELGEEIVEHKVRQAHIVAKCPVLVEDVALEFMALGGLPGPFIKFFVEAPNGLENLCRILDSFDDRSAVAACVFGYCDGERVRLFRAELGGVIAKHPAGNGGFGWDKIFCPDGYGGKTRAELTPDEDAGTFKPIDAVRNFSPHLNKYMLLFIYASDLSSWQKSRQGESRGKNPRGFRL